MSRATHMWFYLSMGMSLTTYLIVLLKYSDSEATEYNGPCKADGIVNYTTKCVIPCRCHVILISSPDSLSLLSPKSWQLTSLNSKMLIKMVDIAYISSTSKAPAPEFTALAEKNCDDYLFSITSDPQAIKATGLCASHCCLLHLRQSHN